MSKPLATTCLLGMMVLLMSCNSENTANPVPGPIASPSGRNPVVLDLGETVVLSPEEVEIKFDSVTHDSRCPIGVYCFWPGMATIRLRVIVQPADTHCVALSVYGGDPAASFPQLLPVDTLGYRFTLLRLDPYPVYSAPTPDSEYTATLSVFPFSSKDSPDGEVMITDLRPTSIQVDGFGLHDVSIDGDVINLTVSYSGGCFEHPFILFMSPSTFAESCPVQANLHLRHHGEYDPCREMITRDLSFDSRPIAELYESTYGTPGFMVLNFLHCHAG